MKKVRTTRREWLPWAWLVLAVVVAGVIFYGSLFRRPSTHAVRDLDKVVHFAAYAALALLLSAGMWKRFSMVWVVAASVSVVTLYGVSLECAQELLVASRNFDVWDILADFAGGGCGALTWAVIGRRIPFLS